MLKNYIIITARRFFRAKLFSIINIIGLSIGLTCCLLIGMFLLNEFSYDEFHLNKERVYRVNADIDFGGEVYHMPQSYAPLAARLKEFESVEDACRLYNINNAVLKAEGGDSFLETGGLAVDHSFFNLFTFPTIVGNQSKFLLSPNQIVLTKSLAIKYFGSAELAINKIIQFDVKADYQVVGVIDDIPNYSNLKFDFLIPFDYLKESNRDLDRWDRIFSYTYFMLKEGKSIEDFRESLNGLIQSLVQSLAENEEDRPILYAQNIGDIHLKRNSQSGEYMDSFDDRLASPGDIDILRIYGGIAFLILLIAIINFMNLSTAMFVKRVKDVGIRKAVGASRAQLITNYLGESVIYVVVAMFLALLLADLLLPAFNDLIGTNLTIFGILEHRSLTSLVLFFVGFTLFCGLVAGVYPVFFITKFSPKEALRGEQRFSRKSVLQKTLVIGQFSVAIIFIIGTLVVGKQLDYVQKLDLGFDQDQLVSINLYGPTQTNTKPIFDAFTSLSIVKEVSFTYGFPESVSSRGTFGWEGRSDENEVVFDMISADPNFINTFGIEMVEGQKLPLISDKDTTEYYLLNERALREMLPDFDGDAEKVVGSTFEKGIVAGIIKDFRIWSVFEDIPPMGIKLTNTQKRRKAIVKVVPGKAEETVRLIGEAYKSAVPDYPLELRFVDEMVNSRYNEVKKTEQLYGIVSILAITISCLGLFGLAAFTTEQRTKEIGIRKVLGGSVKGLVILMSKEFITLVILAILVASPIAAFVLQNWLEKFHERITLEPTAFFISGIVAIALAFVTVSFHVFKVAQLNPSRTLKSE